MSSSNGTSDDQSEVQEQLKLVALGCNQDCHEQLDRLFREEGVYTWLLTEYLLVEPANTQTSQKPEGLVVVEPFIERRLEALSFIPKWSPDPNEVLLVPSTEETRKEYLKTTKIPTLKLGHSKVSKILLECWGSQDTQRDGKKPLPYFRLTVGRSMLQPSAPYNEPYRDSDLLNYYLNDYFWTLSVKGNDRDPPACDAIALPIASARHFYGVLVVQCPAYRAFVESPIATQEKLNDCIAYYEERKRGDPWAKSEGTDVSGEATRAPDPKPLGEKLVDFLYSCAREKYLPILALCHNRLAEKKLKKKLDEYLKNGANPEKKDIADLITGTCVYDLDDGDGAAKPGDQDLDEILVWLWRERKQWLEKTTLYDQNDKLKEASKEASFKPLQDSLRFWDYGVASQVLLRVVDQVMRLPFEHKENPTKLDAALVVGGPGSGKDNLARLVPLFCKGYAFAKIQTINMAAIRPQALVGPILQGLEPSASSPWGFESILPLIAEGESHGGKTVILDELNSMDIDQQGVLLRILENAEISPLMSREPKRTDFLCVGVMNEDPEDLMKEEDLRSSLTRSPLLGRILGTVTDELFRQSRRLRPDLYYRMARPAVLKIPPLAQRPHDIPLLFYIFLPGEKKSERYDVDLAAYRALMDKTLPWPGNVRELQAVTTKIHQRARKRGGKDSRAALRITRTVVEDVLDEHFRRDPRAGESPPG